MTYSHEFICLPSSHQPFTWKAGVVFVVTAAGLAWFFEREKGRLQRQRTVEATKGVGKPKVGGPFNLIDHNGQNMTAEDLKSRYSLVGHFCIAIASHLIRSTLVSRTAQTFAPMSWTKWPRCLTWYRPSAPTP